jgi:hypothetical protein
LKFAQPDKPADLDLYSEARLHRRASLVAAVIFEKPENVTNKYPNRLD